MFIVFIAFIVIYCIYCDSGRSSPPAQNDYVYCGNRVYCGLLRLLCFWPGIRQIDPGRNKFNSLQLIQLITFIAFIVIYCVYWRIRC